jgi:oligopeptide transport system ATP-binding protein
LINLPQGCPFLPRCKYAVERCLEENPPLEQTHENGRLVACWQWQEVAEILS